VSFPSGVSVSDVRVVGNLFSTKNGITGTAGAKGLYVRGNNFDTGTVGMELEDGVVILDNEFAPINPGTSSPPNDVSFLLGHNTFKSGQLKDPRSASINYP
jgi:hypothetical protein